MARIVFGTAFTVCAVSPSPDVLRGVRFVAAASRPAGTFVNPSFNIALRLENPAKPGVASTVTVHGAKLDHWSYGIPEDDFVMERVSFKALWVSVEDEGA